MNKKPTIAEKMSEETIIAICCDYMNKSMTTRQIVEKYKISYGTLMGIIDNNNIDHRNPKHKTRNRKKGDVVMKKAEEVDINIRTFNGVPVVDGREHKPKKETPNTIENFYEGKSRSKKEGKEEPAVDVDVYVSESMRKCECGCTYNPQNAKFCCACGKQLRTDKEIIVFRIEKLCDYLQFAANGTRDRFRDEILSIIHEVNEKLK